MEDSIKSEIESLQMSLTFFVMLVEDYESGFTTDELIDKYTEDWYTQWSYTMTPWSIEVFKPLFQLLQDFETSNPNDLLLNFYWSKFDILILVMWTMTHRLGTVLNSTGWLGSIAPKNDISKTPYNSMFNHPPLKKIHKSLLVEV